VDDGRERRPLILIMLVEDVRRLGVPPERVRVPSAGRDGVMGVRGPAAARERLGSDGLEKAGEAGRRGVSPCPTLEAWLGRRGVCPSGTFVDAFHRGRSEVGPEADERLEREDARRRVR
jgi:hypothetical protein